MRLSNRTTEQLVTSAAQYRSFGGVYNAVAQVYEELIDRREADESELRKLERSLAYSGAAQTIEVCAAGLEGPVSLWFDLDDCEDGCFGDVQVAARYLTLRGLLETDPEHPDCVSIRDESEATA